MQILIIVIMTLLASRVHARLGNAFGSVTVETGSGFTTSLSSNDKDGKECKWCACNKPCDSDCFHKCDGRGGAGVGDDVTRNLRVFFEAKANEHNAEATREVPEGQLETLRYESKGNTAGGTGAISLFEKSKEKSKTGSKSKKSKSSTTTPTTNQTIQMEILVQFAGNGGDSLAEFHLVSLYAVAACEIIKHKNPSVLSCTLASYAIATLATSTRRLEESLVALVELAIELTELLQQGAAVEDLMTEQLQSQEFNDFIKTNYTDLFVAYQDTIDLIQAENLTFAEPINITAPQCLGSNSELQETIDRYLCGNDTEKLDTMITYGSISDWCFSPNLTDFSCAFGTKHTKARARRSLNTKRSKKGKGTRAVSLDPTRKRGQDAPERNLAESPECTSSCEKRKIFDEDISKWDLSKAKTVARMFAESSSFNQPIGTWNVSLVSNFNRMFKYATVFNQSIGNWNMASATDLTRMFIHAQNFNQDITNWNVASVSDFSGMFFHAEAFNQPIGNWSLASATSLSQMFLGAKSFNQPLNSWTTSKVTNMRETFSWETPFNQPLSNWDTGNVERMTNMFRKARSFNQDISNWNVQNVTSFVGMFEEATAFNQNLCPWNGHITAPGPFSFISFFHCFQLSGCAYQVDPVDVYNNWSCFSPMCGANCTC